MHLIRSATLTVSDIGYSSQLYCDWLGYSIVEDGTVSESLAKSWDAPQTAGCSYVVLAPESNASVYIRMIAQPARPEYVPLTTFGWAAIEICIQDVESVNAQMLESPFEIVGPPKVLDGMPHIFPMQVKGPDGEIIYLTQITGDMSAYDLPRAQSPIDKLFILVLACSDMDKSGAWLEHHLLLNKGARVEIIYSMINNAFGLPQDTKHPLATLTHERDVFIEIDGLPSEGQRRARHEGMLPPCVAMGSFIHPDFDRLCEINEGVWVTPPEPRDGVIYQGKRTATLKAPDGTLIEVIEA